MRPIIFALPALVALTACGNGTQGADTTAEEAAAQGDLAANSSVAPVPSPRPNGTPASTEIPEALQGRWGLVPADCTSTRGDAKGLLTVGADKLEFYESVGTLKTVADSAPTHIRGTFEFQGEGMTWQHDVTLDAEDGGRTLVRRESGADAAPGPFSYTKCT